MESVYGVQLLDDLHGYFPDILYEPERFESVQDLLGYIQAQAQEHFNLYTRGQRMHAANRSSPAVASVAPPPRTTPTPASTHAAASVAAGGSGGAAAAEPAVRLSPAAPSMQRTPLFTSFYQESTAAPYMSSLMFDFGTDRGDSQILTSLLGLALGGGGVRNNLPRNFMDPVVVRPTREQIDAGTDHVVLEQTLEENCAICQDRMEARNPTRKIRACGHSFHTECIDTWFERSVSCPVCRHDIRETSAETGATTETNRADGDISDID
jgi:hypothetical protein